MEKYNLFRPLTILPRRDKERNWIKKNPILRPREICVVYNKITKYKLGDGKTDYIHLPFVSIEKVLEEGIMYSPNRLIRVKGFIKDYKYKKENESIMYNPNYDKLPPQQGWQCPLCKMIWAPSVVSCACNKNEVGKKDVSNTTPLKDSWTITTFTPPEIDYPDIELINTLATVDTKTTPKDEPDCRSCQASVSIMLTSNPPQDGGVYCSALGKKNPTKDECPDVIKYV